MKWTEDMIDEYGEKGNPCGSWLGDISQLPVFPSVRQEFLGADPELIFLFLQEKSG